MSLAAAAPELLSAFPTYIKVYPSETFRWLRQTILQRQFVLFDQHEGEWQHLSEENEDLSTFVFLD